MLEDDTLACEKILSADAQSAEQGPLVYESFVEVGFVHRRVQAASGL